MLHLTARHCTIHFVAERRRDFWSAYFGVSNKSRNGLEKFEMQAVIARTAHVDKDLIAFDVVSAWITNLLAVLSMRAPIVKHSVSFHHMS